MKQYGLRYLYKHLGQALKDLPFEITNHNKVIALVTAVEQEQTKFIRIKSEDLSGSYDLVDPVMVLHGQRLYQVFQSVKKEVFNPKTDAWEEVKNEPEK